MSICWRLLIELGCRVGHAKMGERKQGAKGGSEQGWLVKGELGFTGRWRTADARIELPKLFKLPCLLFELLADSELRLPFRDAPFPPLFLSCFFLVSSTRLGSELQGYSSRFARC